MTYNAAQPTNHTLAECEEAVGKTATIHLTGRIISADESPNGPFVRFQVDERWGFGEFRFGIDLDALDVTA